MTDLATAPYRIDFASYNAFVGAWLKRTYFTRRNLPRFLLFAVLIAATSFWNSRGYADTIGMVILALISILGGLALSAIVTYAIAPALIWLWQAIVYFTAPLPKRLQSARLNESGVEKAVGDERHLTGWNGIHDVVEVKKAILLFTNRNCAMIVPRSAFATPRAATVFFEMAETLSIRAKRQVTSTENI